LFWKRGFERPSSFHAKGSQQGCSLQRLQRSTGTALGTLHRAAVGEKPEEVVFNGLTFPLSSATTVLVAMASKQERVQRGPGLRVVQPLSWMRQTMSVARQYAFYQ
jgi:hypothetical protein